MLKFLIFIIAIQINLFTSSNIKKNRITFDKTFNLYYVGIRYQIIKSYCQCHIQINKNAHWNKARYREEN